MTRRQLGIGGLIVLMLAVGIWALLSKRVDAPATDTKAFVVQPQERDQSREQSNAATKPSVVTSSNLWSRPSAKVAARNAVRVRFSLLKVFGADDQTIDRLARGEIAAVVQELKQRAQRGDAAAANVLDYMMHRTCGSAIMNGAGSSSQERQLIDVRALPPNDAEWLRTAIEEKNIQEKPLVTVCRQSMDKNEIAGWVAKSADQGNGASLYLLSTFIDSHNSAFKLQKLQESADAGFRKPKPSWRKTRCMARQRD